MTENEKLIGIETMRSRVEAFHVARLERIGMTDKIKHFRTAKWSRGKVLKEFRGIQDEITPGRVCDFEMPTPKSEAEMAEIIKNTPPAALIG